MPFVVDTRHEAIKCSAGDGFKRLEPHLAEVAGRLAFSIMLADRAVNKEDKSADGESEHRLSG
jgi:hypothetical protein